MTLCNKQITRKSRDGSENITPVLAYRCELRLNEEGTHEGPCSNPSDPVSRDQRIYWERSHDREEQLKRHAASGLGQTQSIPMTSASIVESDDIQERYNPALKVGRKHPSEPVNCPYCPEQPMHKDLIRHIQANHAVGPVEEEEDWGTAPAPPSPEPSHLTGDVARDLIRAIPMPPVPPRPVEAVRLVADVAGNDDDFLDATIISAWFVRNVDMVPLQVREAWGRISARHMV